MLWVKNSPLTLYWEERGYEFVNFAVCNNLTLGPSPVRKGELIGYLEEFFPNMRFLVENKPGTILINLINPLILDDIFRA